MAKWKRCVMHQAYAMRPTANRSNLDSPAAIRQPCDIRHPAKWALKEADVLPVPAFKAVAEIVIRNLGEFVRWSTKPMLLWEGCSRNDKYHTYPEPIKELARRENVRLDGRTNGPAVAAFKLAGGARPPRFGSKNEWNVHHLYSGKFPYCDQKRTLHAAFDGSHMTQSAGLVAVHPIADQMCDEYPFFTWLLRAMAFQKFGYDPDHVFAAGSHDRYGFANGACEVFCGEVEP